MQTGFRMHGEGTVQQLVPRIVRLSGACPRSDSLHGSFRTSKSPRELSAEEQQELRRKINSRERKRMQDLNVAMDALREVMIPYFSCPAGVAGALQHPYLPPGAPPTGRRLSKISTLVLARNYILFLGSSLQEMRRLLGEVSIGMGVSGAVPSLLLTGGWPFLTTPGQLTKCPLVPQNSSPVQDEPSGWASGNMLDSSLCQCGVCQTRAAHLNPGLRFSK